MTRSLLARLGFLTLSLSYWLTGTLCAQSLPSPAAPAIIPPSPVAQEFQRFLGYAVNGATGTADVTIPLYTLQLPGLQLPFSLRYNTSGIKVQQTAGVLGYGWSLFPGFRITRTVMGKADDWYDTSNINPYNNDNDYLVNLATPYSSGVISTLDGQLDIFTIHLPTVNGGFVLRSSNGQISAVTVPHEPLQITPSGVPRIGSMAGFEVKDAAGIRYLFGASTVSEGDEYLETANGVTTSWLLRRVILPGSNNEIELHYINLYNPTYSEPATMVTDAVDFGFSGLENDMRALMESKLGCAWGTFATTTANNPYPNVPPTKCLSSLTFSGGSVVLNYSNPNTSGTRLNSLTVATTQQIIRTINFTADNVNPLLKKVSISGVGISEPLQYSFAYNTYNGAGFIGGSLAGQDWWGYYNGPGGSLHTPQVTIPVRQGFGGGSVTIPGGARNPHPDAMQANSLRQITFPTGGYTRFTYEPHFLGFKSFSPNDTYTQGGGLRITKTEVFDPVAGKTIVKTYAYGALENGMATMSYPMNQDCFIDERFLYATPCNGCDVMGHGGSARLRTINANPRYGFLAFVTPIWYRYVTEYSEGGKTEYEYQYLGHELFGATGGEHIVEVPSYLRTMLSGGPNLVNKKVYKATGATTYVLQQETDNNYSDDEGGNLDCVLSEIIGFNQDVGGAPFYWTNQYYNQLTAYGQFMQSIATRIFRVAHYQIALGRQNLHSTTVKDYNPDGTLYQTQTHTSEYDQTYPFNLTATEAQTSDGSTVRTNYYYPTSPAIPGLNSTTPAWLTALRQDNRLTELVEKTTSKGLRPLSRQLTSYRSWAPGILEPEVVSTAQGTAAYEPRLRYYDYDAKGNVLSVGKEQDGRTSYVWGYQATLPIAEVKNAPVSQVAFTSFEADSPGGWTYDGSFVTAAFTGRRGYGLGTTSAATVSRAGLAAGTYELHLWAHGTGVPQVSGGTGAPAHAELAVSGDWHHHRYTLTLPATATLTISTPGYIWLDEVRLHPLGARMVSYTHEPLVGVTSQTGPDGRTTFYEYDGLGRLVRTRDEQQRILGQQQYHYVGQP